MGTDRDWEFSRNDRAWRLEEAGIGVLRAALLFGSVAVALALLVAPMVDQGSRSYALGGNAAGLDAMSTGSVRQGSGYTVRRSVLQPSPNSVCIIRNNGMRSGDC